MNTHVLINWITEFSKCLANATLTSSLYICIIITFLSEIF